MERGFYSVDSLSGIFALVVDTDKERRNVVTGILRYCGALVSPVETVDGALAIMQLLRPDVVVVDFSRPGDDALELIRSVRALQPDEGGTVATIAVGDEGLSGDLARTHGFDEYVSKPIDPWRLCELVAQLTKR